MNGYLMHKDSVVSRIENDIILNDNYRLPLMLKKGADITPWICSRAVDRHRTNSRLLKKVIRLTDTSDVSTVLKAHAATVTDNYWIKFDGENIEYKNILLNDDSLADVALFGTFESISNAKYIHCEYSKSPELTNIGSFEKCWKLKNSGWLMYKKANHDEMFSELFIYKLGIELGFRMAEYERGNGVIKTKDFTDNAITELAKEGFDKTYGARPLRRAIQSKIEDRLSELILDKTIGEGSKCTVDFSDGEFQFNS